MEFLTEEDFETAHSNGISKQLLMMRCYRLGWDKKRAITQEVNANQKWVKVAESNGIKKITYHKRRERGMSPEEAATTPVMTPKEKGRLISEAKRRAL